jgi:ABC-2 type transport system ATP-binding protein
MANTKHVHVVDRTPIQSPIVTADPAVAVDVVGLKRTYRTGKGILRRGAREIEALRGITFAIERGELFGLLGPNGAGKTTAIKVLTTLLLPTAGTARVLGFDVAEQAREVRRHIGYVFGGDRGLYDRLSALDNLRYFADVYRVPVGGQRARIDELLELVGLKGRERERVETYSRGMKQRLHIARGLLHDPPVLFLDEPTIGLDPVGARELRQMIARLNEAGKTILLTTHYMFEADDLCQRIAVISAGEIVATGTPADLKARIADRTIVEIEAFGASDAMIDRLRSVAGVTSVSVELREQAQVILVQSSRGAELVQPLLRELQDAQVGKVVPREPTLEDAYVDLVGSA